MSSDEVLAASLWSWPDPIVKRDRNGQIIFVNAMFLQTYGGRVSDWAGNMVPTWPAVISQGAQRFETRHDNGGVQMVYDWVETILADGNALVIARNVTNYTSQIEHLQSQLVATNPQTPETAMVQTDLPPQETAQEAVVQAPIVQEPQVEKRAETVTEQNIGETDTVTNQAITNQPITHQEETTKPEPVFATAQSQSEQNLTEQAPDLDSEFDETLERTADDHAYEDNRQSQQVQEEIAEKLSPQSADLENMPENMPENIYKNAQEQSASSQTVNPAEEKLMQKRALPIEDSTAVLGSNWRDQVIAKAVGADVDEIKEAKEGISNTDKNEDGEKTAAGLQILLAEDNAINALLTRTLLEADGAEVDTVEDGKLAFEAVKKKEYDLIFMDMRMPNMDGLEATRKIRAYGYNKPIVALTANAFDDDRNACFDSGMNDFMTKPVSAEELSEMVTNWTQKREQKRAS